MTDVRSREIAVARYIGYELTRDVIDGYGNEFAFMVSCPAFESSLGALQEAGVTEAVLASRGSGQGACARGL
jgi:hypothetical protein